MIRRKALRHAVLLAFGMVLGKFTALRAQGGRLTVDLNQWDVIVFTYKKKTLTIPMSEVFEALEKGPED